MASDIASNQGALLLGGYAAATLAGIVAIQILLYFRMYWPADPKVITGLVLLIGVLDGTHTGLTCAALWNYLIDGFGVVRMEEIPLTLSLTILLTAMITFLVQGFYAHRILLLSKRNWYLAGPIILLATLRLASATATSVELIRLRTFPAFKDRFGWLFSTGLALSCAIDIIITLCMSVLLQRSRARSLSLDHIIDSLILYTFETGSLTCFGTTVSMICWLAMSGNLVFMALHLIVAKLYANSLLASLNTRQELRHRPRTTDTPLNYVDIRVEETTRMSVPSRPPSVAVDQKG
ncbi:hypothetical protein FPV67DRAFT_1692306 [Lyophyllum atratum]|nr:hypothetical protein FPV67DRAFT_1692306 [Lyophyllum atratum]